MLALAALGCGQSVESVDVTRTSALAVHNWDADWERTAENQPRSACVYKLSATYHCVVDCDIARDFVPRFDATRFPAIPANFVPIANAVKRGPLPDIAVASPTLADRHRSGDLSTNDLRYAWTYEYDYTAFPKVTTDIYEHFEALLEPQEFDESPGDFAIYLDAEVFAETDPGASSSQLDHLCSLVRRPEYANLVEEIADQVENMTRCRLAVVNGKAAP